jgi:hypothetical protein
MLLGFGASVAWGSVGTSAIAADTVTLKYNQLEFTITTPELRVFATTGEIASPLLRGATQGYPAAVERARLILSEDVALEGKVEKEIGSSIIGAAVLEQLDQVIDDASGQDNVAPIQAAVLSAYGDDGRVSILEVIEEYPESNIVVNVSNVEQAYTEVVRVIEQVEPVLSRINDILDRLGIDRITSR